MSQLPEDREGASASSPGASPPGEPGYEGRATVGDEGAVAGPESFQDPFGRPEPGTVEPEPEAPA